MQDGSGKTPRLRPHLAIGGLSGLGYLFYTATTDHDLPLMQGLFLFYTLAVLVCVLVADLLTAVLDPRTREA